jgi:YesN/AraC family two-component response regulator
MQRVLIVDDEAQMRSLLEDLLEDDYAISTASNGAEALQRLQQDGAELIITDLVMPTMNGIDLVMAVRKQFPTLKIIAISGGGGITGRFDYLPVANLVGASRVIRKPFTLADIRIAVREVLAA